MKKIFSILVLTIVSLLSFSIVHAKGGGHSFGGEIGYCVYDVKNEYKITVNVSKDSKQITKTSLDVPNGGLKSNELDSSEFADDWKLVCSDIVYVKESKTGKGREKYSVSLDAKDGYDAATLVEKKDYGCVEWSEIQSKYDASVFEKRINELSSSTNNPNSYIIDNGSSFGVKEIDDKTTCEEYKAYNLYYFNTLNPTYGDSTTKVSRLSRDIQSMRGKLLNEKVCDNSDYTARLTTLIEYQNKVDSFLKAGHYEAEVVKKYLSQMQLSGSCDVDPNALDKYVDNDLYATDRYKKEAMMIEITYNFQDGCSIIGGDFRKFLNTVLFYIKIIAIVLAVILSLLDYIKAASGSDDKPMTKANNNFITRLILIIVLFLLPVILTFLLNILHINNVTGDSIQCLELEK